jgi:hypothetical protein
MPDIREFMRYKDWLRETNMSGGMRSSALQRVDAAFLKYDNARSSVYKLDLTNKLIAWASLKEGGGDYRSNKRNSLKDASGLGTIERLFSDLAEDVVLTGRIVEFLVSHLPKPQGLTAEFMKNPVQFMRTRAMSPPDDFSIERVVDSKGNAIVQDRWGDREWGTVASTAKVIKSSISGTAGNKVERRINAGGIRQIQLIQHDAPQFPGAFKFKAAPPAGPPAGEFWLPIHWLPWNSLNLLQYQIPPVPSNLVEPDDEEHPRFFFTAGINGCSVFASGDARTPTVTHAGITGNLHVEAGKFWRSQMLRTKSGHSKQQITGEINSAHYMFKDAPEPKRLAEKYRAFLEGHTTDFKVEIHSPFGCVFGVRYGSLWTLYLQQSVVYNKVRFYKGKDLKSVIDPSKRNKKDFYDARGNLAMPYVDPNAPPVPMHLRPKSDDERIYSVSERKALPLRLTEMYPNRRTIGDLSESVAQAAF